MNSHRLPPKFSFDRRGINALSCQLWFLNMNRLHDLHSSQNCPPEIRVQIYDYALYTTNNEGFCVVTKEGGIPEPPLLFTCKAIRKEATEVFYHRNLFLLKMTAWDLATEVLITRKTKVWGDDRMYWRQQTTDDAQWKNLMSWFRRYREGETHPILSQLSKRNEFDGTGDVFTVE
jgi:hypothetical protein